MSKERKFQLTTKNKFKRKKLKFTTKPAIALYAMLSVVLLCGCQHSQNYCGKVSEKYLLHKNNGGTHNVVFYCDSLHKFVNVSVTEDCYVNTKEGETVCFTLSDYQVGKKNPNFQKSLDFLI